MIRAAVPADAALAAGLALRLWPGHTEEELTAEMAAAVSSSEADVFLAFEECRAGGLRPSSFAAIMWREPPPAQWDTWKESTWKRRTAAAASLPALPLPGNNGARNRDAGNSPVPVRRIIFSAPGFTGERAFRTRDVSSASSNH